MAVPKGYRLLEGEATGGKAGPPPGYVLEDGSGASLPPVGDVPPIVPLETGAAALTPAPEASNPAQNVLSALGSSGLPFFNVFGALKAGDLPEGYVPEAFGRGAYDLITSPTTLARFGQESQQAQLKAFAERFRYVDEAKDPAERKRRYEEVKREIARAKLGIDKPEPRTGPRPLYSPSNLSPRRNDKRSLTNPESGVLQQQLDAIYEGARRAPGLPGDVPVEDPTKTFPVLPYKEIEQGAQAFGEKTFPIPKRFEKALPIQVAKAAGSTAAGVPLFVVPGVGKAVATGLWTASGASEAIKEIEKRGGSLDQMRKAGVYGAIGGMTEAIPMEVLFAKVPAKIIKALAGKPQAFETIAKAGFKMVTQAGVEASQETVQQVILNAAIRATVDPKHDLLAGTGESAKIAAIVGAMFGAGASVPYLAETRDTPSTDTPSPTAESPPRPAIPYRPVTLREPDIKPDAKALPAPLPPGRPVKSEARDTGEVVTPSGRSVKTEMVVVDAGDIVASNRADFTPNPNYPGELQPRDRTRAQSQAQVQSIANNLDPRLLGPSATAGEGAPIIGPDGIVESGNGRALAISLAYARNLPSAERYRAYLESLGVDTSGIARPVLVRRRVTELSAGDRAAFAREANARNTLSLSVGEQAKADADALPDSLLDLVKSDTVTAATNRSFVKAALDAITPESERGTLFGKGGSLSQDGRTRLENALFAKAFGDVDILASLREDVSGNIRGIAGALVDAAPTLARLKADVAAGRVDEALDITPAILEAARLVREARSSGGSVRDLVAQQDAFSRLSPEAEAILSRFFRDSALSRPASRPSIADMLRHYAAEARKATTDPGLSLGLPDVSALDILNSQQSPDLFAEAGPPEGYTLLDDEEIPGGGADGDTDAAPLPSAQMDSEKVKRAHVALNRVANARRNIERGNIPEKVRQRAITDERPPMPQLEDKSHPYHKGGESEVLGGYSPRLVKEGGQRLFHWLGDRFFFWYGPLGRLREKDAYLMARYRALGEKTEVERAAAEVFNALNSFDKETKADAYAFLTNRELGPDSIRNPEARDLAGRVKYEIERIGEALVDRGLMSEETLEKFRGQYLPRMYLAHLIGNEKGLYKGKGGKADLSYLRRRKDIPEDIRQLLGEIDDPAILSMKAIGAPMRDMVTLDFLDTISQHPEWSRPDSMVSVPGSVTAQKHMARQLNILARELDRVSANSGLLPDQRTGTGYSRETRGLRALAKMLDAQTAKPEDIRKARRLLRRLRVPDSMRAGVVRTVDALAYALPERLSVLAATDKAALLRKMADQSDDFTRDAMLDRARQLEAEADKVDMTEQDGFKRVPDVPGYGPLRGMLLRKEIHADLIGAADMLPDTSFMAGKLFKAMEKFTRYWKVGKVPLNLPTVARNVMSNMILLNLSGMNLARVPDRLVQATADMAKKGKYTQIAERHGITASTFAHSEMVTLSRELSKFKGQQGNSMVAAWEAARRLVDVVANSYGKIEEVFKVAKIIDEMAKGATEEKAALEAQKWLFDYSLVPNLVNRTRRSPLGGPFLTFTYKALPRLAEAAMTRPLTFGAWIAVLHYGLPALFAYANDVDDEDYEALRKASWRWMRENNTGVILPWKDDQGRWQFMDLGYTLPWGGVAKVAQALSLGDFGKAIKESGAVLGGPIFQGGAAIITGKDPFTERDVTKGSYPWERQAKDWISYLWGQAAPSMVTKYGLIGIPGVEPGVIEKAIKRERNPYTGEISRTPGQAAARAFGLNVYGFRPEESRAVEIRRLRRDISDAKRNRNRDIRAAVKQRKSREEIAEIRADHDHYIERLQLSLQRYIRQSRVPDKLRTR